MRACVRAWPGACLRACVRACMRVCVCVCVCVSYLIRIWYNACVRVSYLIRFWYTDDNRDVKRKAKLSRGTIQHYRLYLLVESGLPPLVYTALASSSSSLFDS